MKLIILHGPPASGKYTICREIERRVPCRNFHNHLTRDLAANLFDPETDPFSELVDSLRLDCLEAAAKHNVPLVLFTLCYAHPDDSAWLSELEQRVINFGGELWPVFLDCAVPELEKRIDSASRVKMNKITTVADLHSCLKKWNITAIPRTNCIRIYTTDRTPEECAEEIIKLLQLDSSFSKCS